MKGVMFVSWSEIWNFIQSIPTPKILSEEAFGLSSATCAALDKIFFCVCLILAWWGIARVWKCVSVFTKKRQAIRSMSSDEQEMLARISRKGDAWVPQNAAATQMLLFKGLIVRVGDVVKYKNPSNKTIIDALEYGDGPEPIPYILTTRA